MAMRAVRWGLVLLPLFAVGVVGAGARGFATTTLLVQVIGDGKVSASGGQISCGQGSKSCYYSSTGTGSVILTATASSGWTFDSWDSCPTPAGSACSGTAKSCTVAMDADHTVNASFSQSATTHLLTVTVTGNGTVTGGGLACTSAGGSGCSASEPSGSAVTLTATAGSGSGFTGW